MLEHVRGEHELEMIETNRCYVAFRVEDACRGSRQLRQDDVLDKDGRP